MQDMESILLQLPEVVGKSHISVKPCILLIYYCVLREGSCVLNGSSTRMSDLECGQELYAACLRLLPVWQREATGSIYDFMAAFLMVSDVLAGYRASVSS